MIHKNMPEKPEACSDGEWLASKRGITGNGNPIG